MLDFILNPTYWNWLAMGALLLLLEVLGAGGYLLWAGLGAVCVGVVTLFFPGLHWAVQYLLFAASVIINAVFWWQRQRLAAKPSDSPGLNKRGAELWGRHFPLHEPIVDGRGKIKAGDSLWLVSGPNLPAGTQVRVTGQDGVVLRVEPVADEC